MDARQIDQRLPWQSKSCTVRGWGELALAISQALTATIQLLLLYSCLVIN